MMQSNPEMQALMESNPELRNMLQDPEVMRQSMQMMRDPSAMQNMLRQQDLAMSNIENMPGGFNALRRMYTEFQEPMMDAMGGGQEGTTGSNSNSNSNAPRDGGVSGAVGAAMPNPWGSSSSAPTGNNASPGAGGRQQQPPAPFNPWAAGSNPAAAAGAGAGANPWGAMGASGAGGMGGMPSNMNMEQTLQMLENPMMAQMFESMMANPAMQAQMTQMIENDPMFQSLRQSNPQAAAMLSNPGKFLGLLFSADYV